MNDPQHPDLIDRARDEISAMAKQGIDHPSTRPVLIGPGIGAVGALVLHVALPLGILAGAGVALWRRIDS